MTALDTHIKGLICSGGPISIAEYMRIVLTGRSDSYYMRGEAFGAAGDFVTAPEISQVFGELIGLWCVDIWSQLGEPSRFSLVELGPGRGTLMKDALRAARVAPDFLRAASVVLVEVSPVLRQRQQEALAGAPVGWLERFEDLGADAGPLIVFANEFFDASPIRQLMRADGRWMERCVGLNNAGDLAFGAAPGAINPFIVPERVRDAADGSIVEIAPARSAIARSIGERLGSAAGAALVVDYGFEGPAVGDTLQAVKRHAFADVLKEPGTADVTSHVDFAALGEVFVESGVMVTPLAEQGAFLSRLGLGARVAALKRLANPSQTQALDQALQRLTGAKAMGSLFKVLCAYAPATLRPAGFSSV